MVATRRNSHVVAPDHLTTAHQSGSKTTDDQPLSGYDIGPQQAVDDDDDLRAIKRRKTGSIGPEDDLVASLPQLPDSSEDLVVDRSDTFENVARIARAFDGSGGDFAQDSYDPQAALAELRREDDETNAESTVKPIAVPKTQGQGMAKAVSRMKLDSLPILDNLSTQILSTLAKSSYHDMVTLLSRPDTEAGQEYMAVMDLFNHSKRVYSTKAPFLSAKELDLTDTSQIDTLRKANMATFASSLFGAHDISLLNMNKYFLEVFVPEGGRLLKAQGSLLLDLKTQAFIHSMIKDRGPSTDLLYNLFSDDLEAQILSRRPGARGLAPGEQDFIKRAMSRREILLNDVKTQQGIQTLAEKYSWHDFLRDVLSYISKTLENIIMPTKRPPVKDPAPPTSAETHQLSQTQLENNFQVLPLKPPAPEVRNEQPKDDDFVAKAARAAQIALQGHGMSMSPPPFDQAPMQISTSPQPDSQEMPAFQQYQPPGLTNSPRANGSPGYGREIPHVSQTAPTQVLYERARMAASAKAMPAARKAGTPSQRRPWTTEEENALMAGLDRVRGPHWSQILAMFGPGGTINESLKDRNQVQLKDKARNLKLFFLKSGIEVPYYLKYVTGDLKTRAPGQVSKNEARERDRQRGEEDKAHYDGVQGIMALAGGGHSGYTPDSSATNSLPESAQAAYDRVMSAIGNEAMNDQALDSSLATHIGVIPPMGTSGLESPNQQQIPLSNDMRTAQSQSE